MDRVRPLEGKTAIVTSASQGIGRGSALCLGRAGAQVVVNYLDNSAAALVVDEIERAGGGAKEPLKAWSFRPSAARQHGYPEGNERLNLSRASANRASTLRMRPCDATIKAPT
jgi:NAD(P)-dependent dehydrogenase (short-subunit alcohol dehydrogenase family)